MEKLQFFLAAAEGTNNKQNAIAAAGKQKQKAPFPIGNLQKNGKIFAKKFGVLKKVVFLQPLNESKRGISSVG